MMPPKKMHELGEVMAAAGAEAVAAASYVWVLVDTATGEPEGTAYASDKEAYRAQLSLGAAKGVPWPRWRAYRVQLPAP